MAHWIAGHAPGGDALSTKAVRLLTRWLAALCLLFFLVIGASAESFRTPSISAIRVEWRAVLDQLRSEIGTQPAIASRFTFSGQRRVPAWDPRSTPALVQLNAITSPIFAGIGRSSVPVLLPFDTARYLEAGADGASDRMSCRATRPTSAPWTCFTPAPPATTRCSRWIPAQVTACRRGHSPDRSRCRSRARA